MFYVKGKKEVIAIEEDNILTVCPECGRPHLIEPDDMIVDGALDLYGTTILCCECAIERHLERVKEEIKTIESIPVSCDYCEYCLPDDFGISKCSKNGTVVMIGGTNTEGYFWCEGKEFKEMED